MNDLIENRYVIYFAAAAGGIGAIAEDASKHGFTFGGFVGFGVLVIIMVWAWGCICRD